MGENMTKNGAKNSQKLKKQSLVPSISIQITIITM
jgi:hypothetical protein